MPQHPIELKLQQVKLPHRKHKLTELVSLYQLSFLFLLQSVTSALQLFITFNQAVVTADVFVLVRNLNGVLRYTFADSTCKDIHLFIKLITLGGDSGIIRQLT